MMPTTTTKTTTTTTSALPDEVLLQIFAHLVWVVHPLSPTPSGPLLRGDWAADLGSVRAVCRRWCFVATDDLIWRPLHASMMGGTRRRPAWEDNVRREWPKLSVQVALTINQLCATLAATVEGHQNVRQTGWHASFTIKARNVFRCARAIRAAELDASSAVMKSVEPDVVLDWQRAIALGCQDVISRMLVLVRNCPAGWPRALFNEQTLMLSALTGNTNVARMCLAFCPSAEYEGVPTAEVKPERVAMELGDMAMLSVLLPTAINAGWLFQARWPALFLAACQRGELEAAKLIWWRSKDETLARVGLNLAAAAGHLHVVECLHHITGNAVMKHVPATVTHQPLAINTISARSRSSAPPSKRAKTSTEAA